MNIVKQSTGNVVLTDNSGNIVKVFVQVNALDVVSSNEIIVKYGMNQWTTLYADQIDNTQIEPAAAVPFSGNAYALITLLSSSFFFELSGGGGSQNLSDVLNIGNLSGANPIIFDEFYGLIFDNNSRLQEGTIDAGLGGNKGIAQICGLGYELKWESGVLYVMGSSGNTIRWSLYNFGNLPAVTDDSSKGYQIGSLYSLDNGSTYVCSDATIGAAVWALQASSAPNLSSVLTTGNSAGIINIDLNNNDLLNTDKIDFNLATTDTAGVGQLVWNNTDGTLDLGLKNGLLNKLGQQLVVRARNTSGSTITKGSIVKVVPVSGGFIGINLALGDSDANSATAFGIVAQDIADSSNGFVAIHGIVHGLNTNAFTEGDVLYLSPTVAGTFTNVKPIAPKHAVVIGYVAKKNATDGHILLHVQNGYELNELHDVSYPTALANNEVLTYNLANLRWENKTVVSALGYTPVTNARTLTINGTTQDLSANRTFTVANPEGWDVIVKSASQNVNNATLTDDSELQFSVVAGGSYMIQMILATASDSSTNDYKFGFAVSAGTMTGVGNAVCRNAANSGTVNPITAIAANVTNSIVIGQNTGIIPSGTGIVTATIDFGFYATSNGVFKFQFALNSGATTARTFKGTILKYKRLD